MQKFKIDFTKKSYDKVNGKIDKLNEQRLVIAYEKLKRELLDKRNYKRGVKVRKQELKNYFSAIEGMTSKSFNRITMIYQAVNNMQNCKIFFGMKEEQFEYFSYELNKDLMLMVDAAMVFETDYEELFCEVR